MCMGEIEQFTGNVDKMCRFCTDLVETTKHCLWSCGFTINIWIRIITLLLINTSISSRAYTWEVVL